MKLYKKYAKLLLILLKSGKVYKTEFDKILFLLDFPSVDFDRVMDAVTFNYPIYDETDENGFYCCLLRGEGE
jgi:hypothetical protein